MDNTPVLALPATSADNTDSTEGTDRTDVEAAVTWLAERYTMTDASAKILLDHLARQDGVTRPDAARSLLDPTSGDALTPSKPIPRGHHLR